METKVLVSIANGFIKASEQVGSVINGSDMSLGCQFKSRPGTRTVLTEVFHDFLQSFQVNSGIVLKSCYDNFLSHILSNSVFAMNQ
jgi:hypothetical protein